MQNIVLNYTNSSPRCGRGTHAQNSKIGRIGRTRRMNEEQKRLEMALLLAIERETGKSAISDNSKIPEMANSLIDLWAATGQFLKRPNRLS